MKQMPGYMHDTPPTLCRAPHNISGQGDALRSRHLLHRPPFAAGHCEHYFEQSTLSRHSERLCQQFSSPPAQPTMLSLWYTLPCASSLLCPQRASTKAVHCVKLSKCRRFLVQQRAWVEGQRAYLRGVQCRGWCGQGIKGQRLERREHAWRKGAPAAQIEAVQAEALGTAGQSEIRVAGFSIRGG